MPEGALFSDGRVGAAVQQCRIGGTSKTAGWDLPCLLKVLCKHDSAVVDHIRKNITLYKVDRVYFEDNYFDGKTWTTKTFEAGGTSGAGEITFLSSDTCNGAATTLY